MFCYKDLGFFMYVSLFSSSLNGVLHILQHIVRVSLNWKGRLAVKAQNKNSLGTTSCSVRPFERIISGSGWRESRAVPAHFFFVEIFDVIGLLIV